jgi:hypothetical protein
MRCNGGSTFAEDPAKAAPDARLIWDSALDPDTIRAEALPAIAGDPDAIDPASLGRWLGLVRDADGLEHAVLSDGRHHIRIDLAAGTLGAGPVVLHYELAGTRSAQARILPLRRLIDFCLYRRFPASLYPRDPRIARWITLLRVRDALQDGASWREIGNALFGPDRVRSEWLDPSDSLRSRVRRLAAEARRLGEGGYRSLLRRR